MSRSYVITRESRPEWIQMALKPGQYELRFRLGILIVLLFLFALSVWRYLPPWQDPLFISCVVLLLPLVWSLFQPINGCWRKSLIRFNGSQWWIGQADQWGRLDAVRQQVYGCWLIRLNGRSGQGRVSLWLFPSMRGCDAHRRLRCLIQTQSPD